MGGSNCIPCLGKDCANPLYAARGTCEFSLEVHTTDEDGNLRLVACGQVVGPLISELSEKEVIEGIQDGKVPLEIEEQI